MFQDSTNRMDRRPLVSQDARRFSSSVITALSVSTHETNMSNNARVMLEAMLTAQRK
jgi:hypothetical protein